MSRLLLTCVIGAALCVSAARLRAEQAPQHPDFTGTWRVDHVDEQRSNTNDRSGFGGGGFGRGGRRGGFGGGVGGRGGFGGARRGRTDTGADATTARLGQGLRQGDTLRIRQTDDQLILTTGGDSAQMIAYALNGKQTTNKLSDTLTVKTKAKWNGTTLVTTSEQSFDTGRGTTTRKVTEKLSVTDSDTMTVQSVSDTGFGKRTITATLKKTDN